MPYCDIHSHNEPHIYGETMWMNSEENVHSDICINAKTDTDSRVLLHMMLDEWIDHSEGNGLFYLGDPAYQDTWALLDQLSQSIADRNKSESGLFDSDSLDRITLAIDLVARVLNRCEEAKYYNPR